MKQPIVTIRYFTGTGNTKRVADQIGETLSIVGKEINIAPILPIAQPDVLSDRYVFCSPVYALGLPRIFKRYLAGLPRLVEPRPAMLVVTAGNPDHTGWALRHGRELLDARGYCVTVSQVIPMPVNWTPFLPAPAPEICAQQLAAGDVAASQLARDFANGIECHREFSLAALGRAASWMVYHGFHDLGIKRLWRLFRASRACTACGLCAKICPVGAIAMHSGRPQWSPDCEQCCRCFNFCPAKAIEQLNIIGRGSSRVRYHEPGFRPDENLR